MTDAAEALVTSVPIEGAALFRLNQNIPPD
jgi:hypothetical protein